LYEVRDFYFHGAHHYQQWLQVFTRLDGRLEINVTEAEKFGKVTAINIFIENQTGRKIYLDGLVRLPMSSYIREHSGKFVDFSHSWGEGEIYQENHDAIAAANQQTHFVNNKIYDVDGKLMDPDVVAFYNKLKKDQPSIDSTGIVHDFNSSPHISSDGLIPK